MSDILERLLKLEPSSTLPWLKDIQTLGVKTLEGSEWPTRKVEDWKYTNLKAVTAGGYLFSSKKHKEGDLDSQSLKKCYHIKGLDSLTVVFVDGVFNSELSYSDVLPEGLELTTFAQASQAQKAVIQEYHDGLVDKTKHLFSTINNHLLEDGVFIRVLKNTVLDQPLQVVWLTTSDDEAFQVSQRALVLVDENADVTLIEQFVSSEGDQKCLTNGITELHVADGGRVNHYRLHQETQGALHIGGMHVSLKRNAYLNSFHMALGSKLKRIDVVINQDGEGANCILNGIYLPQQDQHIDFHTCIEHRIPHCTTSENFRGIIGGNGRAVFNGRIHIHRDAQKTLAELSNKNLLTSNKAEVDSKPELEIYADDVKCAHGTTVAQLDDTAMHYFQTRGISAKVAEVMLSFGFIKELINEVEHPEMIEYLTPLLSDLFAKDPNLTRE